MIDDDHPSAPRPSQSEVRSQLFSHINGVLCTSVRFQILLRRRISQRVAPHRWQSP